MRYWNAEAIGLPPGTIFASALPVRWAAMTGCQREPWIAIALERPHAGERAGLEHGHQRQPGG